MKFSVWPMTSRSWDDLVDFASYADRDGWHALWYADHYMLDTPEGAPSDAPLFECWSVLTGLAAKTERIRLGSLVSPTTFHHPALLANRAATVDTISGGRLVLGIGAGWQVNEHKAYGVDLLSPKDRVDRFEEAIQIIGSLLHNGRTSFTGSHFTFTDAPCEPKPIQDPLPILVGTGGPRMSAITARFADEWNVWGNHDRVRDALAVIDAACEKVDRDPATLRRTAQAFIFLTDDDAHADKVRLRAPTDRSLIGTSDQIVELLDFYARAGIDEFVIPDMTLGKDASQRRETYERLRTEVLPLVSG